MKQKLTVDLEKDLELTSNVWKFGDDIDTDAIIPGKYLTINKPDELAKHAFEGVCPEFAQGVKEGDIIVASFNFGCGSSREHAPVSYTHLRAHETRHDLVCRLLLEKKKKKQ